MSEHLNNGQPVAPELNSVADTDDAAFLAVESLRSYINEQPAEGSEQSPNDSEQPTSDPERSPEDAERQEKLKKGIKIVIGGPPHSGKSVFIEALTANLDKNNTYSFSAAPDGEGPWLQRHYDNPDVVKWRQKGKFTEEFIEDRRKKIAEWDGPLMIIDVGGRTSEDNARMVEGATHAIILASDLSKVAEWREFFDRQGLEVIAKLHSHYQDDPSLYGNPQRGTNNADPNARRAWGQDLQLETLPGEPIVGSVVHLERGEPSGDKETIKAVAGAIESLVSSNAAYKEAHAGENANPFEVFLPKEFSDLPSETKTARFKNREGIEVERENKTILRSAIPMLYEKALKFYGQPVWLNGPINSWEATALAAAFDDAGSEDIRLRGPDGYIPVAKLPVSVEVNEKWYDAPKQQGEIGGYPIFFIHNKAHAANNPVSPDDLASMTVPELPENAIAVISSQGPNWLKASMALGYKDNVAAVAAFIPGEGSTIAWSANGELLGEMVESLEASQDLHQKAESLRNPHQDRLIALAQEYEEKLRWVIPQGASIELGGSLISHTALKGHNDIDLRLLLPQEYSAEEAIRTISEKISEIVPYQKDRPVGSEQNQQFAVMHQRDLELPEVEGPIEIELSVRPAEGYIGYAKLQAELPEQMLDQYIVYKETTKADKASYKKVKAQFYAMSRFLYAQGFVSPDILQEQKNQLMTSATEKYWGPTLDDILSREVPDV